MALNTYKSLGLNARRTSVPSPKSQPLTPGHAFQRDAISSGPCRRRGHVRAPAAFPTQNSGEFLDNFAGLEHFSQRRIHRHQDMDLFRTFAE